MRTLLLLAAGLLLVSCGPEAEDTAGVGEETASVDVSTPATSSAQTPVPAAPVDESGEPNLLINNAWAPPPPGGVSQAAVYVTIENVGLGSDRLIGAATPVAAEAALHGHVMSGDVARMEERQAIDIPARRGATLAPGGDHIMLMELNRPLAEGDRFPLTLTFERAGSVDITVNVESLASRLAAEEAADTHETAPEH
jgi:copper(I)-binding protein